MKPHAKQGVRQTLLLTLFLVLCVLITKASIQEIFKWPQAAIASMPKGSDNQGKERKNGADLDRQQNLLTSISF